MDNIPLQLVLLVLVGAGGGFVQRVSGFGLGIFAMLFLPYICGSAPSAAAVSCLWSCVTSVYNAVKYRKDTDFRLLIPLVCAAAVTIPLAVMASAKVPQGIMTAILGGVLILLSLYFLIFSKKIKLRPNIPAGVVMGALSGTLNGLFSTGGPPVVLYMAAAIADKAVYFATIQTFFGFTNVFSTAMRAVSGIITLRVLVLAAVGAVGCMIGDKIGSRVFDRISSEKVKKIIYLGMIVSGALMII